MMGKTVTTEFACLDPSQTLNPWNPAHTPGGSSSGSAVSVATGRCPVALGSQTVGSGLRPASYTGVVGLKPTYGRVSRHNVVPVSWSLDTMGWMTRSVEDAALMLQIMAGPDANDPVCARFPAGDYLSGLEDGEAPRISLVTSFFMEESDEESDLALAVLMRADYLDPLARLRRSVLLASAITVVLSALVAIGLAARIAKPLERLSRVALRIQRGRITRSVEVEAGVEIGRLSRAMERMRLGIIQRDEQLRLMLAQVAHEIRNPLGGLKLFSAIAADSADPQERAQLFRKIQAEVDALNSIITDFLVYARPRAPQPTLHDIRGPLREAAELVATELESRGGSLEVELPDAQLEVVADSGQVKRMVLNLLRNAAEAGDRVWLKGAFSNGEVIVSVRDNGPGVPESLRGRIFQPFVTSKERGAGLGLAIVAGVARAHDGRVELVSGDGAAGNGAEFRLYLPGSEVFPVARSEANGR